MRVVYADTRSSWGDRAFAAAPSGPGAAGFAQAAVVVLRFVWDANRLRWRALLSTGGLRFALRFNQDISTSMPHRAS
jgi:hypothetical protein